jgi:hypothetical protein
MAKRQKTRKCGRKNKVIKGSFIKNNITNPFTPVEGGFYPSSGIKAGGFYPSGPDKQNAYQPSSGIKAGGFYPSAMGGIANTSYLIPLALRQGIKLFRNYKGKGKGKRKTRKQRRNK